MMRQLIFSYKVTKVPMKLVTSLAGNNFSQLKSPSYRGRHIWCNFNQIIVNYQRVTKLLKLLIYKYFLVTVLQEVFGTRPRGRKIMLIGRQGYTSSGSCSIQFFPRFLVDYLWRWRPGRPAISALCRDLIKNNPMSSRISQDCTTRVKI